MTATTKESNGRRGPSSSTSSSESEDVFLPSIGKSFVMTALIPFLLMWGGAFCYDSYNHRVGVTSDSVPAPKPKPTVVSMPPSVDRTTSTKGNKKKTNPQKSTSTSTSASMGGGPNKVPPVNTDGIHISNIESIRAAVKNKHKVVFHPSSETGQEQKKTNTKPEPKLKSEDTRSEKRRRKVLEENPNDPNIADFEKRRRELEADPENLVLILNLAEALHSYDLQHQFTLHLFEVTSLYHRARKLLIGDNSREILRQVEHSLGMAYFLGNLFERSAEALGRAIELSDDENDQTQTGLSARVWRASSNLVLGKYREAAVDFMYVMDRDSQMNHADAIGGVHRILQADASVMKEEGGWDYLLDKIQPWVQPKTEEYKNLSRVSANNPNYPRRRSDLATTLKKMHFALFQYHDHVTHDVDEAFRNLELATSYGASILPPKDLNLERMQRRNIFSIFDEDFFWKYKGMGHPSRALVFIVGFFRSGSTLTERILDAHSQVAGMGEDSRFNSRLSDLRDALVRGAVPSTNREQLASVIHDLAQSVLDETVDKYEDLVLNRRDEDEMDDENFVIPPKTRYVDKMLTNYRNIGFIHLFFPNALILHVSREPMDSVLSSYKHDFSATSLEYTNDPQHLASMYVDYRETMEHWEEVLPPGRIVHIRYEDVVEDMPGIAKSLIKATGLPWEESVLKFHKKKQAVNTMSSTQVRKGVYGHSVKSWKKYERHLQPLINLIGRSWVSSHATTTLPGYVKPRKIVASK